MRETRQGVGKSVNFGWPLDEENGIPSKSQAWTM